MNDEEVPMRFSEREALADELWGEWLAVHGGLGLANMEGIATHRISFRAGVHLALSRTIPAHDRVVAAQAWDEAQKAIVKELHKEWPGWSLPASRAAYVPNPYRDAEDADK